MRIGIVSDTHDNLRAIEKIVELFKKEKVELIIHAGDIISPFAAVKFKEAGVPFYAVFGNNDGEKILLEKKISEFGKIEEGLLVLEFEGFKIAVSHKPAAPEALASQFDLVVYGHTHKVDIRQVKESWIVNPGEGGAWLTGKSTCVIFSEGKPQLIEL